MLVVDIRYNLLACNVSNKYHQSLGFVQRDGNAINITVLTKHKDLVSII